MTTSGGSNNNKRDDSSNNKNNSDGTVDDTDNGGGIKAARHMCSHCLSLPISEIPLILYILERCWQITIFRGLQP